VPPGGDGLRWWENQRMLSSLHDSHRFDTEALRCLRQWCLLVAVSRQRLRSASRHQLIVPRHRRTNFGRRAFAVGTRCQTISVIRRLAKILLGDH